MFGGQNGRGRTAPWPRRNRIAHALGLALDWNRLIVRVVVVDVEGWVGQAGDEAAGHHLSVKLFDGSRLVWSLGGLGAFRGLAARLKARLLRRRKLAVNLTAKLPRLLR